MPARLYRGSRARSRGPEVVQIRSRVAQMEPVLHRCWPCGFSCSYGSGNGAGLPLPIKFPLHNLPGIWGCQLVSDPQLHNLLGIRGDNAVTPSVPAARSREAGWQKYGVSGHFDDSQCRLLAARCLHTWSASVVCIHVLFASRRGCVAGKPCLSVPCEEARPCREGVRHAPHIVVVLY